MEDLVPRSAYDVDETGYWERMPVVTGTFMAACGTLIVWATVLRECPFLESVMRGMAGGFMFAVLFPALFRWMIGRHTSSAYAGKGRFAASPPAGFQAEYRLPCSLIRGASPAVGGVLYLGRGGLAFVPFAGTPLLIPIREMQISSVVAPTSWFVRVLVPRPAHLLEVTAGDEHARFVVPTPTATIPRVREVTKAWRDGV